MSNRRKIKNTKTKNHKMNNDKVNNPIVDALKNFNLPTTLMIKPNKDDGAMILDFGTKKDMEDYINLVKKHQLGEDFPEEYYEEIELFKFYLENNKIRRIRIF